MKKHLLFAGKILLLCFVTVLIWMFAAMGTLRNYLPEWFSLTGSIFSHKTYLVLLQNNAELRPTGGFISSFMELEFWNGIPTSFKIQDVFSLKGHEDAKYVKPPYPMEKFLAGDNYKGHSFHDANWSPDLPTSAADILRFYKEDKPNASIDGVITINFSVLEDLVRLVGPLQLGEKTIPVHELFHTIQYEQNNIDRHSIDDLKSRKNILSDILSATLKKMMSNVMLYPSYFQFLADHIENKDIAIWSADADTQKRLVEKSLANAFPVASSTTQPFIVVLGNLGGMKSDRYIKRHFEQSTSIGIPEKNAVATPVKVMTTLTFHHEGNFNAPLSHEYRGYIRTYIPKNAVLIDPRPSVEKASELGYTTLGEELRILPGETKILTYSYTLPTTYYSNKELSTLIYKQSGIENTTYDVSYMTPVDHLLQSATMKTRENLALFTSSDISRDTYISARVEEDRTPPRITNQTFLDYNKLSIQFNEPIQKFDCEHIPNYVITDKDVTVKDITNTARIDKITCKDREAIIQTRNIRSQFGEFFTIEIRNIRDMANNIILPNPMTVTAVQKFEQDDPTKKKENK